MSAKIYIGTAGWSYNDWWGIIYPPSKSRGFDELHYLSQFLNLVEINTTFYRIPTLRMTRSWARRGAEFGDFLFIVKLYQGFTHENKPLDRGEAEAFSSALAPLEESGILGGMLIQYPWSFKYSDTAFDAMRRLCDAFSCFPLAIEVRHSSWLNSEYMKFLARRRIAFVNIDQPLFHDSVPPTTHITADMVYFRLHGRNRKNWFRDNATPEERYDYLYSSGELDEWIPRFRDAEKKSEKVIVVYNNHFKSQAVCNVLQTRAALTGERVEIPERMLAVYPHLALTGKQVPKSGIQGDLFL